jgi:CBS domain-containing protein
MSTVRDLLDLKGSHVFTIGPYATVLDAAQLMNEHKIGCLLVTQGGEVIGILTERDLLRRVIAECRAPDETPVAEAMTSDVLYCRPHTSVDEVQRIMKDYRVRHVPIVDLQGDLHGMVSIGDINAWQVRDHEVTISALTEYIHGRM